MSDITPSLDHLVGACQQCLGNRHAKPIGGFEIDPKLEVRRLFDRDVELASISAMSWRRATAT
jgi:hypothetical protein